MGATQKSQKSMTGHAFTQFELTTIIVKNLKHFKDLNLTAVTKLVLIELSTHYNEAENGAVVFPSLEYIAETICQSLTSVKKAVKDLINAGLIIKTKRSNIKGNFNKYLFTSKITGLKMPERINYACDTVKVQKTTSEWAENEFLKQSESDLFYIRTNKQKQINKQKVFVFKNFISKNGEKLTQTQNKKTDFEILLRKYANSQPNIENVEKFCNWAKASGKAAQFVNEMKKAESRGKALFQDNQEFLKRHRKDALYASSEIPECWKELKKRLFDLGQK